MTEHLDMPPAFVAPPGACDAHFHVFCPAARYPYAGGLRYTPPLAPLDDYLALAAHLHLTRHVFVQPSAYGRDNRCMLDAMRAARDRGLSCRGIVDVEDTVTGPELDAMDALGVRGIRINVSPVHPPTPGLAASMLPRIATMNRLCQARGWHLDFLLPGWLTHELMPTLAALDVRFSLAHLGMMKAADGVLQPGFQALLQLVNAAPRRCWLKLTGVYRFATAPGFADAAPMVGALVAAAPDRLIWGSDYPHLSFADKVGSVQLFNLLAAWLPTDALRRQVLVANPQVLFGF